MRLLSQRLLALALLWAPATAGARAVENEEPAPPTTLTEEVWVEESVP